jgi:hypothetical protein
MTSTAPSASPRKSSALHTPGPSPIVTNKRPISLIQNESVSQNLEVGLARAFLEQARVSKNPVVVAELTLLAKGYQLRAASMDNGKLPDIGEAAGKDEG